MKKFLLPALLLLSGTALAQIPTNGLLGHYPLAGNANDISGNGQHGSVFGATPTADRFGNPNAAMQFDGVNDYILLPNSGFIGLNEFSYSIWAKPASQHGGMVFSAGSDYDNNDQTIAYRLDKSFYGGSHNVGTSPIQSSSLLNNNEPNQWYHLVFTRSATSVKLYVNGVQGQPGISDLTNGQIADYGFSSRVVIGVRAQNIDYFHGAIGGLRAYDHALTPSEVLALYNEGITGRSDEQADNALTVYPNPSTGHFTLASTKTGLLTGARVYVENILGQQITANTLSESGQTINLETQPKGVYFVRVVNTNGSLVYSTKVLIH